MQQKFSFLAVLLSLSATLVPASAATLQQLSMDQMSQLATSVVRARITSSSALVDRSSGSPTIYTHYKLEVSEIWKGTAVAEFMLPGGQANGQRQSFPGVPDLRVGGEYILFLWKSPSTGIIHTIGLTQGIFDVSAQPDGAMLASRRQSGELMVDSAGQKVSDHAISLKLNEMKSRVRQTPASGVAQ